jgi:hypothetical protein
MKVKSVCIALASAIVMAGCSAPALNFAPNSVPSPNRKMDAALVSTIVTVAPKGEATGHIDTAGAEADVAALWKSTLDDAILRMALFRDDSSRKLSLTVKILELNLRNLGSNATTTARYQLVDRNTGATVFTTDIKTEGSASDYVGVNRTRKSANRSVQANIEEFLKQLAAADLPPQQP